jgi:hypothetical protein
MHSIVPALTGVACLGAALLAPRASAQVLSLEDIGPILVVPGQTVDLWFPNVFDPDHPKRLVWEGFTQTTGDPAAGGVTMKFDWLDPLTGGIVYSPDFPLPPNEGATVEFVIPFCPPQVSIHFESSNPAGYLVEGVFLHECVIPEPHEVGFVMALGLLSFGWLRRRTQA